MAVTDGGWIQTYTGRVFYPQHPGDAIDIEDIAHGLAFAPRFAGHTREFYSVAQHSVMVAGLVPDAEKLWALLHDASEAYLADIPRPIKHLPELEGYRQVEHALQTAIFAYFGLTGPVPASVKQADEIALATEAVNLMAPFAGRWTTDFSLALEGEFFAWPSDLAKQSFLSTFYGLTPEAGI
jgi:hypothetical protein